MSFLSDYDTYSSGNESPRTYHTWAGLSCLSHLIGRRIWTDQNVFIAYPNLYIILTGAPGIKKSTAMRLSKKIVSEFKNLPIAGASITREAMIELMAKDKSPCKRAFKYQDRAVPYSHLSIFANEMVNLINSGGNPIGMVDFLTDVWDQPTYRDTTKNKGDYEIVGPFISILGCMTPDSVRSLNSHKIISGGMIRRCIFVLADRPGPPFPFPILTREQELAYTRCVEHARLLQEDRAAGPFSWTQEARDIYVPWYVNNNKRTVSETSSITRLFLESAGELVIKLSMLFSISDDPFEHVHSADNIERAILMLQTIEGNGQKLFEATGRNELSAIAQEVERVVLSSEDPIPLNKLRALFYRDASQEELDKILTHLTTTSKVEIFDITTPNKLVFRYVASPETHQRYKKLVAKS